MKHAVLALGLTVAFAAEAGAQMQWTDRIFINGNGGYQAISKDFTSITNFEVYEETATADATQSLKSEPIFDVSAGYRVRRNLAIGVGFSQYVTEGNMNVVVRVPHPVFTDQTRTVNITGAGASHTSPAFHVNAIWFWPYTDKIDFAFSGGPSIVIVKQDMISGVNILPEPGPSFTQPVIDRITVTEQRKTTIGFNTGIDMTYMVTKRYGFGATARYLWARANLEGLNESLTVGGFQLLGGVRIRLQ
jgi:hypothetical protein